MGTVVSNTLKAPGYLMLSYEQMTNQGSPQEQSSPSSNYGTKFPELKRDKNPI